MVSIAVPIMLLGGMYVISNANNEKKKEQYKNRLPNIKNRIVNYPKDNREDLLNNTNVQSYQGYRNKNENILIHCRFGAQRSANIILLYLIKTLKIDTDISYDLIKQKRPICFFPINSFNHILNF